MKIGLKFFTCIVFVFLLNTGINLAITGIIITDYGASNQNKETVRLGNQIYTIEYIAQAIGSESCTFSITSTNNGIKEEIKVNKDEVQRLEKLPLYFSSDCGAPASFSLELQQEENVSGEVFFCGDGFCRSGENARSCPKDCGKGYLWDGVCIQGESYPDEPACSMDVLECSSADFIAYRSNDAVCKKVMLKKGYGARFQLDGKNLFFVYENNIITLSVDDRFYAISDPTDKIIEEENMHLFGLNIRYDAELGQVTDLEMSSCKNGKVMDRINNIAHCVEKVTAPIGEEELPQQPPTIEEQTTEEKPSIILQHIKSNLSQYVIALLALIAIVMVFAFFRNEKIRQRLFQHKKEAEKKAEQASVVERKGISLSGVKTAIQVSNFTVKHGRSTLLEGVRFEIERGEIVSLLGPSGSGKTTIIEALAGRKEPTDGATKIFERDVKDKDVRRLIGFVPQQPELYMDQTVEQNLKNSTIKWGVKDADSIIENTLKQINISTRKDVKAKDLSGGQKRLLSLGMELVHNAELLILDEPTTGLDPNTRNQVMTLLNQLVADQGKTVLFSTHFMDDAEDCNRVMIIANKKIVANNLPNKLEKMLPGNGKVIEIVLDRTNEELIRNIEKIDGVKKVIVDGRTLRILEDEPDAVEMASKIKQIGGIVNESRVSKATMMEVFVYYTGEKLE